MLRISATTPVGANPATIGKGPKIATSSANYDPHVTAETTLTWGWLDSQVGSVVRQTAKVPGSIPGGAKVLGTDGICKYLPVSVSSYVEVCLCLLCSVCIKFNLQHCGQPWRWLVAAYRPC